MNSFSWFEKAGVPISSEEYEEQQQATMDVRHKLELQTVCAMICSEKSERGHAADHTWALQPHVGTGKSASAMEVW